MTRTNRRWVLRKRPEGAPTGEDLEFVSAEVPEPGDGEFLARTIYLSLDPAQRISMGDGVQYAAPVQIGDVMRGATLSVVEQSRHPDFAPGDLVVGAAGWQEYGLLAAGRKLEKPTAPLTAYMSVLGITGASAYFGLREIGQPQPGETVVVSAAAGAVGSIAGQIARMMGCRVVGLAGSDEKCRYVVETLGFDACVNYRTADLPAALAKACPDGIDVDFENAGGEILDAVLGLMNLRGRVVLCGLISTYNDTGEPRGPKNFMHVLMKRLTIKGFIIGDFSDRWQEAFEQLETWVREGKIRYDVQRLEGGIERAPEALNMLFAGANTGKLLLKVSEEPAPA